MRTRAMIARTAIALCAFAGCSGEVGVLSVSLTTAPGSTLLDSVQTLQLTITNPRTVTTAERTGSGFAISVELPATGDATALLVDGLDASGTLIATGASPRFPTGALSGRIVVYMAAPNSVGAAPLALEPARSQLGVAPLAYGAVFAGGRLASGAPSDELAIYNAFDHSIVHGLPLPEPRAGVAAAVGGTSIFLFGGRDEAGAETATTWRFDTTTAPAGAYVDFGSKEGFARADQLALPIGSDRYLITGAPVAELSGLDGTMVARSDVAALPAAGTTVIANDGMLATIFASDAGVIRFRSGAFSTLPIAEATRADALVIAMSGGKVGVLCGTTDAVRIDGTTGTAEVFAGVPSAIKTGCAAASTSRHLIIAGGTLAGGALDGVVEIYDASTLARVATQPLVVPRTNALALALPNDQIMIVSGVDADGAPVATVELFTPPSS